MNKITIQEFKKIVSTQLKKYGRESYSIKRTNTNALTVQIKDIINFKDMEYIQKMAGEHTGPNHDSQSDYFEHRTNIQGINYCSIAYDWGSAKIHNAVDEFINNSELTELEKSTLYTIVSDKSYNKKWNTRTIAFNILSGEYTKVLSFQTYKTNDDTPIIFINLINT